MIVRLSQYETGDCGCQAEGMILTRIDASSALSTLCRLASLSSASACSTFQFISHRVFPMHYITYVELLAGS